MVGVVLAAAVGTSALATSLLDSGPVGGARVEPRLSILLSSAPAAEPVPVFVHGLDAPTVEGALSAAGLRHVETFRRIGVAFAFGTAAQIEAVRRIAGITYLQSNQPIEFTQDTSHVATRMEPALATSLDAGGVPFDGSGVSVAIVDSGVRGDHEAFGDRVKVNLKYVCGTPFDSTCYRAGAEQQGDTRDEFWKPLEDSDTPTAGGHGTHVAGIAAASPSTTTDGVSFRGAAPGADVVALSVGAALSVYGAASALNWVIEHHANPCEVNAAPAPTTCAPIKAINNSYGPGVDTEGNASEFDPDGITAKLQAELVDEGITMVWAAGNDGGDGSQDRVNPDAKDPRPGIIGVANYDDGETGNRDNALESSSSRGLTSDATTWPDLSAPGTNILSTCGPALSICKGTYLNDPEYGIITGTSMAAPHIAGYVAVLLEANPTLTPGQIEFLLEETAHKFTAGLPYAADPRHPGFTSSADKGHGLVDMAAAIAKARGLAIPPVGPTGPACSAGASATSDGPGDAAVVAGPTNPTLDLRRVELRQLGDELVGSFLVEDLRADTEPPVPPSVGEAFDLGFTHAGETYYLRAQRQFPTAATYRLRKSAGANGTGDTNVATGTGAFDPAANVVTIRIPVAAIPGLAGAELTSLTATTWSVQGAFLLRADQAGFACPMTVSASAGPPPPPPPPLVCNVSIGDRSQAEGDRGTTAMTFQVTATGSDDSACQDARVEYSLVEGTATSGSDYENSSGPVVFGQGMSQTRTITVSLVADTADEPDETFEVALAPGSGTQVQFSDGDGSPRRARATILDDDPAPSGSGTPPPGSADSPPPPAAARSNRSTGADGYRMVAADGGIFTFGDRAFHGSTGSLVLNKPIVGGATDISDFDGYWIVASDGGVFAFNAEFYGSLAGQKLAASVVEIEPTPTGKGYWIVLANGKVYTFGDANFFGDISSKALNQPVIGMSVTPSGKGYWLVAQDGGIFNYGDAGFFGSMGDKKLNAPVIDLAPAVDNNGYYLLGRDGGVFTFGSATFKGSTGSLALNAPVVAMLVTPTGAGYWLAASDGGLFAFADAEFLGSMGGTKLNSPVLDLIN